MGETVEACPDCDSTPIKAVVGSGKATSESADHSHFCQTCGARFDEPVERPARASTAPRRGLAAKLARGDD